MYEKVNPSHPDKLADRIAGALVDMAYARADDPRIAVEVLIGHGACTVIAETSVELDMREVDKAVQRISGIADIRPTYIEVPQDEHLAGNQSGAIRCGDNGIFLGMPITEEQRKLSSTMRRIYDKFPYDGKAVVDNDRIILCQSHVEDYHDLLPLLEGYEDFLINPLGPWTGGIEVDAGAMNRKLGSDMGDAVTGGGTNGKDLSKADVSVNIYAHLKAQETGEPVRMSCAIGDTEVDGVPYAEIVEAAREYIDGLGGFEKFAEWGLI